jgi:hypothetical protein
MINQGYILETNITSSHESSQTEDNVFIEKPNNIEKCENKTCPNNKRKINTVSVKITKTKCLKLCQFCVKAWKNGQYCSYCVTIYKDNSHSDGKDWVCCDSCGSWQHVICEEKKGNYHNLHKQISDESFQYYCPLCKNKKKKKRTTQKNDINCKLTLII